MPTKVEGPLKILLFVLVAFVLVIVVGTLLTPYTAEYEVKIAGKVACNEFVRNTRASVGDRRWEAEFVNKCRVAGVVLPNDQFNFSVSQDFEATDCHFEAKWYSNTPWMLLGDFTDIKPLRILHDIDYVHRVKKKY